MVSLSSRVKQLEEDKVEYGVVPVETVRRLSGLEFMTAIQEGRLPGAPIAELIGFRLAEVLPGAVVFVGEPGARHLNPLGSVHGGYAATLLDSCMGCAVHTTLAAGQGYTTMEFKISFIGGMTPGTGPVRAEGRVLRNGRRAAFAEGRLVDGGGKLVAHATTTCLVFAL